MKAEDLHKLDVFDHNRLCNIIGARRQVYFKRYNLITQLIQISPINPHRETISLIWSYTTPITRRPYLQGRKPSPIKVLEKITEYMAQTNEAKY